MLSPLCSYISHHIKYSFPSPHSTLSCIRNTS
nr:MAG TPA: hypothetical protein [Bacteriophage sp.]